MTRKNIIVALGVLCLLLPFSATTQGAVTALRYFHFGDADSEPGPFAEIRYGMAAGAIATSTKDSASTNALITSGSPVYTGEGANEFSARSIAFNGSTQRATTPGPNALTTDFGVEAWVKPTTATGKQVIVYCGTPGVNGWGLIQQADGHYPHSRVSPLL